MFFVCVIFLSFLVNRRAMQLCARSSENRSEIYETPTDVTSSLVKAKNLECHLQQDQMSDLYQQGCYMNSSPLINGTQQHWAAFTSASEQIDTCASLHSSPSGFLKPSRWNVKKLRQPARLNEKSCIPQYATSDESVLNDSKKLLILMSSRCLDKQQAENQKTALEILKARRVPFETVDGMKSINRKR